MKRSFFLLIAIIFIVSIKIRAELTFDPTMKYRITCAAKNYQGSLLIGTEHKSIIPLLYHDNIQNAEDSFWYIKKNEKGYYTIQNAKTMEYIQFSTLRIEDRIKGLILSKKLNGDSTLWNIISYENSLTITSVADPTRWFNLRVDGSNLMGTFYISETPTNNEQFIIYDEKGNQVIDDNSHHDLINPENYGIDDNEFWEAAGLDQPFVLTTDRENPILYHIKNINTGKYVNENEDGTYSLSSIKQTQFYFIKAIDGIQIYSVNNNYAITNDNDNDDVKFIKYVSGISDEAYNNWKFDYINSTVIGYSIYASTPSSSNDVLSKEKFWTEYEQKNICYKQNQETGSAFILTSSDLRHKTYLEENGFDFENIPDPSNQLTNFLSQLKFDAITPIYDKKNNIYMLSIPSSFMNGKNYNSNIIFQSKNSNSNYTLEIEGTNVTNNTNYTFENVNGHRYYHINLLENNNVIATDSLICTFMPIVELTISSCNGNTYTEGRISIFDGDTQKTILSQKCKYKYRGATAQSLSKKSFNVKFLDENSEKKDVQLFGLREDNSWVLDAMGIDLARMRNRVSTDLWNDFSHPSYYKEEEKNNHNGTRGHFVEVLMNGSYHGIYCMTEKIDRKQLKLKKIKENVDENLTYTIRGCLYKSKSWGYAVFMGHNTGSNYYPGTNPNNFNNNSETWESFEVKYPELDEGEDIDWEPLYNGVALVAQNNQNLFDANAQNTFDLPVVLDYYLFIDLMLATDNHGKNMYYSIYNKTTSQKLSITPWDLDGTWGRDWYGRNYNQQADQDFESYLWAHEHGQLTLFKRLRESNYYNFEEDLKNRYQELRSNYFHPDSLCKRFENYEELFSQSGADQRESKRWNGANGFYIDIPNEIPYITNWIQNRIDFLDDVYDYDPLVGISHTNKNPNVILSTNGKTLYIRSEIETSINIYNLLGQLVNQVKLQQGVNVINNLPIGVYIINKKKIIIH